MEKGWYHDPHGRYLRRYFDGSDWTNQVQAASGQVFEETSPDSAGQVIGVTPNPPSPGSISGDSEFAPPKDKSRKKTWIGIGIGILIIAAVGNALGGGSSSESSTTQADSDPEVPQKSLSDESASSEEAIGSSVPSPRHPSDLVISGDFQPPAGSGNTVEVVWYGPAKVKEDLFEDIREVNLVVRNNTQDAVGRVNVSAIVRDTNGDLLDGSEELRIDPNVLEPGAWGVGTLEIKNLGDAKIGSLTFNIDYDDDPGCSLFCPTYAELSEISQDGETIKGLLTAPERMDTVFGVGVYAYCFNEKGEYLGRALDFTADETLEEGQSTVFVIDVPRSACPNFALEAYDL